MAAGAVVLADMATSRVLGATNGSDKIRVGIIGCGGRGRDAARNCLASSSGIEIVAAADLFEGQAKGAQNEFKMKDDHVFWGFDSYAKLIASDVDMIIDAGPPAFRPDHLLAAAKAGKHIFSEKPVGVDPVGCRIVIEAANICKEKNLGFVAGTQRRHEVRYVETMKRIHDGDIGELVAGQCYWVGGGIWFRGKDAKLSDLEWQCHNWYHWDWLSGDQVCEQHIHNIDIMNWCFNGPPKKIWAQGGRQSRDEEILPQIKNTEDFKRMGETDGHPNMAGNIYDHMTAELEYANGARCFSVSGHIPHGNGRVGERIVGTKGTSNCCGSITGEKSWNFSGEHQSPYVQEHADLIKSIRDGKPLNEGVRVAESTLTAIGIRMSAYTGREFSWDWLMKSSKLDIVPKDLKPGPGHFPAIAVPGKTKLV